MYIQYTDGAQERFAEVSSRPTAPAKLQSYPCNRIRVRLA